MKRMSRLFTVKKIILGVIVVSFIAQSAMANPVIDQFEISLRDQTKEKVLNTMDKLLAKANDLDKKIAEATGESKPWFEYDAIDFDYDKNVVKAQCAFEQNIKKIFNLPRKDVAYVPLKKLVRDRDLVQQKMDSVTNFYNIKFIYKINN